MATPRPTILLTGFGAFPGVASNATADLIPQLAAAARERFAEHEIIGEVLPVAWNRAPATLEALLARASLRLALHFGVSHHVGGFQVELIGRNVRESRRDATGELPNGVHVLPAGPPILAATLPAEKILSRLSRAGLPCCTSNNAGKYLCNALMYHSLAAARRLPTPYLSGFIHVPAALSAGPCSNPEARACRLTWAAAVAGGLEIIAACLEDPPA